MTPTSPDVPESNAKDLQEPQIDGNAQEAQQCSRSERKQVILQKFMSIMETASPQAKIRIRRLLAEAVAFVSDPKNSSASVSEFVEAIRKKYRGVDLPEDVKN